MTWSNHIGTARGLEPAAAAVFGAACAFAAAMLWPGGGTSALGIAALCFLIGYGLSLEVLLRNAAADAGFMLQGFEPAPLELASDELLLEDTLEPAAPDSRVVQLFGTRPTSSAAPARAPRDDTKALLHALSELRRSFR